MPKILDRLPIPTHDDLIHGLVSEPRALASGPEPQQKTAPSRSRFGRRRSFSTGCYPRLPLVGLRAILSNRVHLAVDGERQQVTLRTPDWRTRLLRWLS